VFGRYSHIFWTDLLMHLNDGFFWNFEDHPDVLP